MSKTKILIVSNSHVGPTGMGEALRLIFGGLLEFFPDQYELLQLGLFHISAVTPPLWPIVSTAWTTSQDGRRVLKSSDRYGQQSFRKVCNKFNPTIVFAFNDFQKVEHLCIGRDQRDYSLILYLNVDSIPAQECPTRFDLADRIFTKSLFALRALRASQPYLDPNQRIDYIYSPADTERFRPVSCEEKLGLRRDFFPTHLPESAFVLGWVGQNQWRKQIWLAYKAIRYLRSGGYVECQDCRRVSLFDWDPILGEFRASGKVGEAPPYWDCKSCVHCNSLNVVEGEKLNDVYLWLHTPLDDPTAAWPLDQLETLYRLERGKEVLYTQNYSNLSGVPPEDMPKLYQIWDALLFLSGGEGFGLPPWEAMCTGIPVVYSNYSSHAEFLKAADGGLPVGGTAIPTPNAGPLYMLADVGCAVQAVLRLYRDRGLRRQLGKNGREFVLQYNRRVQAERWHHVFQESRTLVN